MFVKSESGAVTVDWVVLTAGLVGLGLASMSVISSGVENASSDVATTLTTGNIIMDTFDRAQTVALNGAFGPEWTVTGTHYNDPFIDGGSGMFLLNDDPTFESTFSVDPSAQYVIVEMDITALGKWERPGSGVAAGYNDYLNVTANGASLGDLYLEKNNSGFAAGDAYDIDIAFHGQTNGTGAQNSDRLALYGVDGANTTANLNHTHSYTVRMVVEADGSGTFDLGLNGTGTTALYSPGEGVSFDAIRVTSTDRP